MENKEKEDIKLKFGLCIRQIIEENKEKAVGKRNHAYIDSLRKLEAASGVSFTIIQKISTGDKNPELTTIAALAEGLGLGLTELFAYYDALTDNDLRKAREAKKEKRDKKYP